YSKKPGEFWFKPIPDSELSTTMTAEGYRKIATIQQLILNGRINNSSKSPLYWDEPESNLNPKLMKMIVESLLEISRNGKQVFVATHDYALLKWFDLLANKDVNTETVFGIIYSKKILNPRRYFMSTQTTIV
ncbi:AAA family ATPase, partial [Vibrio parahaemolyticus]